jgi:uncharacterized protein
MQTESSTETLKRFFAAFGRGDGDAVVATFDPSATLTAVRSGPREPGQLYGSYLGAAGVRDFVTNLGGAFDTQAFSVDRIAGEGEVAVAHGSFTHRVKSTGRLFHSAWALVCTVRGGRIVDYRFFEDSAALAAADPATALSAGP